MQLNKWLPWTQTPHTTPDPSNSSPGALLAILLSPSDGVHWSSPPSFQARAASPVEEVPQNKAIDQFLAHPCKYRYGPTALICKLQFVPHYFLVPADLFFFFFFKTLHQFNIALPLLICKTLSSMPLHFLTVLLDSFRFLSLVSSYLCQFCPVNMWLIPNLSRNCILFFCL